MMKATEQIMQFSEEIWGESSGLRESHEEAGWECCLQGIFSR